MPWGPAGTDKTASEQRLLDAAMRDFPHVLAKDRIWFLDRLWHGVPRLKALAQLTHFAGPAQERHHPDQDLGDACPTIRTSRRSPATASP